MADPLRQQALRAQVHQRDQGRRDHDLSQRGDLQSAQAGDVVGAEAGDRRTLDAMFAGAL